MLVWLANLFQELAWMLFVHFPGFLSDLGAAEIEIGAIFGIGAVAAIAVRPAVGRGMDLYGRRTIIIVSAVANAAVIALYLTITGLGPWVYAVRILHGLAGATLFTAYFTYAADVVPERRRTQGLALFGISGMLPIALGGVVGDAILSWSGFDTLFLVATGLAISAVLLSLPLRDVPGDDIVPGLERRGFGAALRQPNLAPMWWLSLVFSLAIAAYFTFLKTFTAEAGFGSVGVFFAAYGGIAIALRIAAGWVPDRFGPKRVLVPALIALGAGFVVLAGARSAVGVAVAGLLCGTGHGYAFPIMYGMVVQRARASERGAAMAIYTGIFDIGALIGGPLFGLAIALSSYRFMWSAGAALVAVGTVVYLLWDRGTPVPGAGPQAAEPETSHAPA